MKRGLIGENKRPRVVRTTAAAKVLDNGADIAKIQEWLGHANIAPTRIHDYCKTYLGDSQTFKVSY